MLSPRPYRAAPPGFPRRGLPGRSGAEPRAGRHRRSGRRGARPASAFPLPCRVLAELLPPSRGTAPGRAGTGRAAAPPAREGGPEPAGARAVAGGDEGRSARQLRGLRQRRNPPVAAGGGSRGCGGRVPGAVGEARSAGSPAAAFRPSASCFHSLRAPFPHPSVSGQGRGGPPASLPRGPVAPARGRAAPTGPGRRWQSRLQARMLRDASSPLPSHFVVLFIFLNKLSFIYGLSLSFFFFSLPPATC